MGKHINNKDVKANLAFKNELGRLQAEEGWSQEGLRSPQEEG